MFRLTSDRGLKQYLEEISQYSILTKEEEFAFLDNGEDRIQIFPRHHHQRETKIDKKCWVFIEFHKELKDILQQSVKLRVNMPEN